MLLKKTSHWVGHSKLKPLDLGEYYKGKIRTIKLMASLTGTTIEQLDYGMKNNPDEYVVWGGKSRFRFNCRFR